MLLGHGIIDEPVQFSRSHGVPSSHACVSCQPSDTPVSGAPDWLLQNYSSAPEPHGQHLLEIDGYERGLNARCLRHERACERLMNRLASLIAGSDAWTARRRDEFVGSLKSKPGLLRYLRRTNTGLLRIDKAAAQREAHLDGKWLLRTSDQTLTAEDLAAAYKQLLAVEAGWHDMKSSLGLRPVFHHREDRIRAHIQLCWLALLLIRVVENSTGDTWRNTRHELDRLHLVTMATGDGQVAQRSAITDEHKAILAALELPAPFTAVRADAVFPLTTHRFGA